MVHRRGSHTGSTEPLSFTSPVCQLHWLHSPRTLSCKFLSRFQQRFRGAVPWNLCWRNSEHEGCLPSTCPNACADILLRLHKVCLTVKRDPVSKMRRLSDYPSKTTNRPQDCVLRVQQAAPCAPVHASKRRKKAEWNSATNSKEQNCKGGHRSFQ